MGKYREEKLRNYDIILIDPASVVMAIALAQLAKLPVYNGEYEVGIAVGIDPSLSSHEKLMPGPHTYSEFKYESTFEKDCFKHVRDLNQCKIRVEEHLEFLKGWKDNELMPDQLHFHFESNFALPLNTTKEAINDIISSAELNILDKGTQHYELWLPQLTKNIRNAEFELSSSTSGAERFVKLCQHLNQLLNKYRTSCKKGKLKKLRKLIRNKKKEKPHDIF